MPEKEQPQNIESDSHQQMVNEFAREGIGEKITVAGKSKEVPKEDDKRIEEIRSTFNPPPESLDDKMRREIKEKDHQISINQSRREAARKKEAGKRVGKRNAALAALIAVGSFFGLYKGAERQAEVDKIKDTENAARQKTIDQNRVSQRINYDKRGQVESVDMSDGTKYEVKK